MPRNRVDATVELGASRIDAKGRQDARLLGCLDDDQQFFSVFDAPASQGYGIRARRSDLSVLPFE